MMLDVAALDLVAMGEIADMLGVSRQRVHQLVSRSDFPKPAATLSVGRIWRRADVAKWAAARGRLTEA